MKIDEIWHCILTLLHPGGGGGAGVCPRALISRLYNQFSECIFGALERKL